MAETPAVVDPPDQTQNQLASSPTRRASPRATAGGSRVQGRNPATANRTVMPKGCGRRGGVGAKKASEVLLEHDDPPPSDRSSVNDRDAGEGPDRRRLAAPPTCFPANPRALCRHAAGEVPFARRIARAMGVGCGREDEQQRRHEERPGLTGSRETHTGMRLYRQMKAGVNESTLSCPGPANHGQATGRFGRTARPRPAECSAPRTACSLTRTGCSLNANEPVGRWPQRSHRRRANRSGTRP